MTPPSSASAVEFDPHVLLAIVALTVAVAVLFLLLAAMARDPRK